MPDVVQAPTNTTPATTPTTSSSASTSKTTVAVGVSYNSSEARKFSLDVTAMAEVSAELVGVPAPTELTRLLAERIKQQPKAAAAAPASSGAAPADKSGNASSSDQGGESWGSSPDNNSVADSGDNTAAGENQPPVEGG